MFRKFKDKLAEEMKSSPQRLQQFAQAAQAVVTSASSSISDISNNDLFSIADDGVDTPQKPPSLLSNAGFQDISLSHSPSPLHSNSSKNEKQENGDKLAPLNSNHFPNAVTRGGNDINSIGESPPQSNYGIYPPPATANRIRRLSNSSTASDVSFRLPSYESPGGMFHLQSDLDISASEMEDNVNIPAQLERVSKEHLYAAYRKTNEKYNKYRGRYTDLARHYRNLERENAKAKAVLVETQDKALRRISELREQCQLEQSAKAHLENALRLELDERNLKIESLNTKIKLLQSYNQNDAEINNSQEKLQNETQVHDLISQEDKTDNIQPLIDLSVSQSDDEKTPQISAIENKHSAEVQSLNNKITKLEQLLVKCKETIKTHKDKNTHLNSELQIVLSQLEKLNQENEKLHSNVMEMNKITKQLDETKKQVTKLQDELNGFEVKKVNDMTGIKSDLHLAKKEISSLNITIDLLKRREEENVISLAENKLSIHKELEGKENEIKSLNESISKFNSDIKSKDGTITNLKKTLQEYEDDKKMTNEKLNELNALKIGTADLMTKLNDAKVQHQELDAKYIALLENLKCTELQLKQEIDEKLAIIDRNKFLESRNKQMSEENALQLKKYSDLERESQNLSENVKDIGELKKNYIHISEQHDSIKLNYEQLLSSKSDLEDKLRLASENIETLNKNIAIVEEDKRIVVLRYDKLNDELTELQNKCEHLNLTNDNFNSEINNLKLLNQENIDELNEKILSLQAELTDSTLSCNKYEAEIKNMQNEIRDKSDVSNEYESKLSDYSLLKDQFVELNGKYEDVLKHCKTVEKELDVLKLDYDNKLKENMALIIKIDEVNVICDSLKTESEVNNGEKLNLQKQVSSLESESEEKRNNANKLLEEIKNLQEELANLLESHKQIVVEKNAIEEKITKMEQLNNDMDQKNGASLNLVKSQVEDLEATIQVLKSDKEKLLLDDKSHVDNVSRLETSLSENEAKLKEYLGSNDVWEMKLSNILDDNNMLQEKCGKLKSEKESVLEHVSYLEQKISDFEIVKAQFEEVKLEKEFLNMRVSQLDTDLKQASGDRNKFMLDIDGLKTELTKVVNENKQLLSKSQKEIEFLKDAEIKLENNLKGYMEEKDSFESRLRVEIVEKEKLFSQLQNLNEKSVDYQKLLEEKENIEAEFTSFKGKLEGVEKEKGEEINQLKSDFENNNILLSTKIDEFNELSKKHVDLKGELDHLNVQLKVLQQIEADNVSMTEKMHFLEEENSRLTSSIEGLQNHLTKVSIDNSQLNDKIRDMLANGEAMLTTLDKNLESTPNNKDHTDQAQLNQLKEVNAQLKEELKSVEDVHSKVMDLERQNSILIEEKLELEDQIKTSMDKHMDMKESNDSELKSDLKNLNVRFESVANEKMELESRLANLELINRSNDSNMRILEQKNQKLGLTNEKLERRLDETLVSLNHIRNLEENTELEYLRNILYEYLTGPSNNNLVLAKVLAAVVKFDHRQTQLVLEREKERQGLLSQLGLL